jgi:type I restriction enzyme, S subunit
MESRLGGNYPNQDREAEYPLMKMGNLARGHIDLSKVEYITQGVIPDQAHRLSLGDVLFNTRNTLDLVGKVAIWRNELLVAYYNSNLMRLEFDKEKVCSNEYANYSLNSADCVSRLRALATGTTSVAAIYTRDLLRMPFILAPLPEQRAIAEALSDVDALIDSLDKLIAKKRDIKQGAMQELLTGKKRLPGFNGEWKLQKLGIVGSCLRGVSYDGVRDLFTYDTQESIRLLRSNNVQEAAVITKDVQYVNRRRVSPHQIMRDKDILVCMANGSKELVGKAGFHSLADGHQYTFGAFMGVFRTDADFGNPAYVFSLFQSGKYRSYLNSLLAGSSINNLTPTTIESLEFSMPPLSEQAAIAEVLSDMDAEISALEQRRDKTVALKQGMMQELLTGRIRLV